MTEIELFVQGEGIAEITLVRVAADATVRDALAAARAQGAPADREVAVFAEDSDEPLDVKTRLDAAGIGHRARIHVHRCRKVGVSVTFNGVDKSESFPSAATIARVDKWATGKDGFNLPKVDAPEHVLQICDTVDRRPDDDVHIGTLTQAPSCAVCFDLVPKQRIEG